MRVSHTTFKVASIEKSLEFYKGILELDIVEEINAGPRRIVFVGEKDSTIELIEGEGVPENPGEGVSVGMFYEKSLIQRVVERAKAEGIDVAGPISPNPHLQFFFLKDPDGYTIQLCESL